MSLVDSLKALGFTGHESQVYISLVKCSPCTGYELAQRSGLPRANVYAALSSLADKGAAIKVSADPARYTALPPAELMENAVRQVRLAGQDVVDNLKLDAEGEDRIYILEKEETLLNKAMNLIDSAVNTVYISATAEDLIRLHEVLSAAIRRNIKLVVLAAGDFAINGAIVYRSGYPASWTAGEGRPFELIVDSGTMLSGELGRDHLSRGVSSQNPTLVMMSKHNFVEEIILADITARFGPQMESTYGPDFISLRERILSRPASAT